MPTIMSHAVAAWALGSAFRRAAWPARVWWAGAACAILPDADVAGFYLGVPLAGLFGHRGLTHSFAFAAVVAAVVAPLLTRRRRGWLWIYLFLATASHGVLDAMTNGGIGVAFFAPFDTTRYYLPWRPIVVSPISLTAFLSAWGAAVLASEALWVWFPSSCFAAIAWWATRRGGTREA
ncbi:MAG TPA: metal-dependent hydrolase [Methylomirabilota bacterium]|jgi:inner membrane protein|nr:metal-dependent hydrolase [Methylomirabilota bacterium]